MTSFLVTQHYEPDQTSTALFLTAIAAEIATGDDVVVLSGSAGSAASGNPTIIEIPTWKAPKGALIRRGIAMLWICTAASTKLAWRARRNTPVFVVTSPFPLPYFTAVAARIRKAPLALIIYDLYPEVLIATGIISERSWLARLTERINKWMFSTAKAVVIIGRDMEKRVAKYGARPETTFYIPHWPTLSPGERPIERDNPFRAGNSDKFIVGLSGNLGFTHDPETVFKAAQILSDNPSIHFLLSGWGVGWEKLVSAQEAAKLPNVTLVEPVAEADLETFLAAADVWIIPYRRNMAGVSAPSRLYNLLAIGRPIVALSEPDAEHSLMLREHDIGWVIEPENATALADTLVAASRDPDDLAVKRRNAVRRLSDHFSRELTGAAYRSLVRKLHVETD